MATSDSSSGSIQAIDRAFLVLETIAHSRSPMSLNDLHQALQVNKASLFRIVQTLCNNGYLNRDEKAGTFTLSLRTFEVGMCAVRNLDYLALIRKELEALSAKLDVLAQFSIEDNNELLCLESFDQHRSSFSIYTSTGSRTPLYASSAGKAILSTYSNDEIRAKWEKMNAHALTPNTITTLDDLMKDISKTRTRNYALDLEENELGLFCVGTVLLGYNRKPLGAISLSVRTLSPEREEELSHALLDRAQHLSYLLGYSHH